jgi:hypothetical protein
MACVGRCVSATTTRGFYATPFRSSTYFVPFPRSWLIPQMDCSPKNTACQDPFYCGSCLDNALVPCLIPPLLNMSSSTREADVCSCFTQFQSCVDALAVGGKSCEQNKQLCSLFYLTLGNRFFGDTTWPKTWTCNQCVNPSPTFVMKSCQYNFYCDNTTDTCADKQGVGQPCLYEYKSDNDAPYFNKYEGYPQCGSANLFTDEKLACDQQGKCVVDGPYLMPGDTCTAQTASSCYSGVCTAGKCDGYATGAACNFTQQCNFGLYCSNTTGASYKTCIAEKQSGAICEPDSGLKIDSGRIEGAFSCCLGAMICPPTSAINLTRLSRVFVWTRR